YYLNAREYDLAAASYDAAVRDALPQTPGAQPVLFVFSAGNSGNGSTGGEGGLRDSILSPGTAKNVITVGGIEQPRTITNEVVINGQTNAVWIEETDSQEEVAHYSGRGNVGFYKEGDHGRFKPDVVAPGSFVVSTRSTQMDTNAFRVESQPQLLPGLTLNPNQSFADTFFVPANAVRVSVQILPNRNSPFPFPPQMVWVDPTVSPPPGAYSGTNAVIVSDPTPVDTYWNYAVSNGNSQSVLFDLLVDVWVTNETALAFEELNQEVAPYYRYESGSSMAAAKVSGVLALMQEFFEQRLGQTNSPALMKALLINGARSVGNLYDFQVTNEINFQGWGIANLANSVHAGLTVENAPTNSMFILDQSPTNALATGQSHTFKVSLSPAGQAQPLRVTLVWTDPPGNPAAGVKLVNDLDLIVTNMDNTVSNAVEVYYGNNMFAGNDFTRAWDTNGPPLLDVVNNVENVYLSRGLSQNYSITVVGRRVNVNAVPGHTNDVVQDFALVVSSGDGVVTNAFSFANVGRTIETAPNVTVVTNRLPNSTNYLQGRLERQRAGAHTPMLGTNTIQVPLGESHLTVGVTNQWRFYTFTNMEGMPYLRFRVSTPVNLAVPRMGAREGREDDATREQPDIDLYVSRDLRLTNLFPEALSNAFKSYGRLGTEAVYFTNAQAGEFYAGVKVEDQMA
ncbi:MAG TPA: S8 family serine peptidase, partial [Clostridia bacterium]|nr:S8 family serine peptidase [Clostridia bacterium]